jgi:hypothetical protein
VTDLVQGGILLLGIVVVITGVYGEKTKRSWDVDGSSSGT